MACLSCLFSHFFFNGAQKFFLPFVGYNWLGLQCLNAKRLQFPAAAGELFLALLARGGAPDVGQEGVP